MGVMDAPGLTARLVFVTEHRNSHLLSLAETSRSKSGKSCSAVLFFAITALP